MKNKYLLYSVCLVVFMSVVGVSCKKPSSTPKKENGVVVSKNTSKFKKEAELTFIKADSTKIKIDLELAQTEAEKATGLMDRPWMEENQSMLFIFDKEESQAFWMHNTIISLDIMYLNAQKQIVHIAKNCAPMNDTNIPSIKPAKYVVEVIGGFSDKFGIKDGDYIEWTELVN